MNYLICFQLKNLLYFLFPVLLHIEIPSIYFPFPFLLHTDRRTMCCVWVSFGLCQFHLLLLEHFLMFSSGIWTHATWGIFFLLSHFRFLLFVQWVCSSLWLFFLLTIFTLSCHLTTIQLLITYLLCCTVCKFPFSSFVFFFLLTF